VVRNYRTVYGDTGVKMAKKLAKACGKITSRSEDFASPS
jgi:hypothetical protein